MIRIPEADASHEEFAQFSFQLWEGLNGKYNFYINRWRRTLEFLRDQHWETLKQFDRSIIPNWRSFPLHNYTLAFYNDYLTDYLKSEVRFSALPASGDPEDLDAAEMGESTLKHLWELLNFDRIRIDLGAWVMATGVGVLRVFWNTNTGEQIPLAIPTPDGQILPIDPNTLQPFVGEPIMVDAGEIGVEVVSPQFVRWAENPAHGVMIGLLLTYEEASTYYGKENADKLSYSDTHEGISADLNQIEQPGVTPSVDKRALVIEHYLPRSAQHPEGLWWTSAQSGKLILHKPWALPAGRIPVVSFRWIPIPGEKHIGLSPLYGITFQNKVYEEIIGQLLEWYKKAKPKRLLKAGGGITMGDITDEPYQELVVNAGAEPDTLKVDDAPAGLYRILEITKADMQVVSGGVFEGPDETPAGFHRGSPRTPKPVTSKSITTAFINAKAAWKEVGELLLLYAANFYDDGRVVAVQGPDRAFLWRKFSGDGMLRGEELAARIIVDDVPLFPQNRQNLRDTVIGLLQSSAGSVLFAGPDGQLDMERVDAAFKATGIDVDLDFVDPDVLEARNEQVAFQNMQQGQEPPAVESWQNHVAHYDEHTRVLKSLRFKSWPEEAQQAFLQHVQQTGEILDQQAQEEMQTMVEQERALRHVREQEELRGDAQREWVKALVKMVADATNMEMQDIMGILQKATTDEPPSKE